MARKTPNEDGALVFDLRDMISETLSLMREARALAEQPLSKARATSQVTNLARSPSLTALNERELMSVYALCAWVANEQDTAQETVQAVTEARFGVNHVTKLPRKDYDEVIKFLIDLRIDEMKN